MIMRLAAAAGLMSIWTSPALATEWFICSDGEKASFSVLVGSLGVGSATDFTVSVGDKIWSTKQGEGIPIVKSQAYENDSMLLADVAAEDLSSVVAELRVFKSAEADAIATGGTLRVAGEGVWAVSCPNE